MGEDELPIHYERRKPQVDEFVRWAARIVIFLMILLNILMVGFWRKLDNIYNGNPNSNGRELSCAVGKDDAEKDPEVKTVWLDACAAFVDDLGEP